MGWVWLFEILRIGMLFECQEPVWDGCGFLKFGESACSLCVRGQCGMGFVLFLILRIGMVLEGQEPVWDGFCLREISTIGKAFECQGPMGWVWLFGILGTGMLLECQEPVWDGFCNC